MDIYKKYEKNNLFFVNIKLIILNLGKKIFI